MLAVLCLAPLASLGQSPDRSEVWIDIPDEEILIFTLADGRDFAVRLAPKFAPVHVENIIAFAQSGWWEGRGSVYRVQDNAYVQWGEADAARALPSKVIRTPPAEFERPGSSAVIRLSRPDPYSQWAGFTADGWPIAGDDHAEWLAHCYGMVGVARDEAPDTGDGRRLYTVIGTPPRSLDRNMAVVGRIIDGVENLATLPRGQAAKGYYSAAQRPIAIAAVRLATDLPKPQRPRFQYPATAEPSFADWIHAQENREPKSFFVRPAGGVDICQAMPPIRRAPSSSVDREGEP